MKPSAKKRTLPVPLAREVERRTAQAAEAARAEAESLIDVLLRRKASIDEAFYDMGVALAKLREKRLYTSLGFRRFDDLVVERLAISPTHARRLVRVTRELTRASAVALGQERALALVRLAASTDKTDSAETLAQQGISLPGKRNRVLPAKLTVRAILGAIRAHHRSPPGTPAVVRDAKTRLAGATTTFRKRLLDAGATRAATDISLRGKGTDHLSIVVQIQVAIEDATALAKLLGG
jgi:hypothetical protein